MQIQHSLPPATGARQISIDYAAVAAVVGNARDLEEKTHPMGGLTLYDKVWDQHVVKTYDDGDALIYIDRHLSRRFQPASFCRLDYREPNGATPRRTYRGR